MESLANSRKNFDNYAEIFDKDGLLKTICRQCGGEGKHMIQYMDGNSMKIYKTEIVNCDKCEDGYKYGFKDRSRRQAYDSVHGRKFYENLQDRNS